MNEIELEKDIIILSTRTIQKLFSYDNGADVVALYLFYHKQCKLQGTNQSFTVSDFVKKGLHWGDDRFKSAKRVLRELGLVEDVRHVGENGRVIGWYIKLNYIRSTSTHPISTPMEIPSGGLQETNAGSILNINAGSIKENTSRSFSNENSQEEKGGIVFVEKIKKEELSTLDTYDANASPVSVEKNKKKKSLSNTSVAKATTVFGEETIEILKFFADSFKTAEKKYFNKTKASERIQEVLGTYSKEQVQTAITNYKASKKGDFTYLKTPETFFGFEDDKKTRFIDRFMDSEVKPTIKLETQEDWMAGW